MTLLARYALATTLAFVASAPTLAADERQGDQAQQGKEGRQAVVYKPPLRGAPATRVGGGTRDLSGRSFTLSVLAPDHTGRTVNDRPVLYWFTSEPVAVPVEVTIVRDNEALPLLEARVEPPLRPGVQSFRVGEHGVRLQEGVTYQWFVALVTDPAQRSLDIVAGGEILHANPSATMRATFEQTAKSAAPLVYAEGGFWYDAVQAISELIESEARPGYWREQRASLLEQVGLVEAAAYERVMQMPR